MQIKRFSKKIVLNKKDIKKFWLWLRSFPLYTFFLPIYVILYFLGHNISQVDIHAADRLLLFFSLATLLLLVLLKFVLRDLQRAAVVIFVFSLIFFTYPHIKTVLHERSPVFLKFNPLLPASILLMAATFLLVFKIRRQYFLNLSMYLNGITLALIFMQVYVISNYEIKMTSYWREAAQEIPEFAANTGPGSGSFPDVYFIVLDGYARADVLEREINFDNSQFINTLRGRHFYVADCSISNYGQTEQSLASTFNMTYLDDILSQIHASQLKEDYYVPFIKDNLVRRYFESLGYETVSFYTGYDWAQWNDATYFIGDPRSTKTQVKSLIPFESSFLSRTILKYLLDDLTYIGIGNPSQTDRLTGKEVDRGIVLNALNQLPVVAAHRGPKLVFAHILLPHPPYVFGPNGEAQNLFNNVTDIELLNEGYRDQVQYANKRIIPIIDSILAASRGNAIIVLEGDHGIIQFTDDADHMKNLEAYYFPNQDYSSLYPTITPVNSFRVILSQYFGQDYPLLKDYSYFMKDSTTRDFILIPNTCTVK